MRSLFHDFPVRADFYSRIIDRRDMQTAECGGAKLIMGSCSITSIITGESADVDFAAIYPWNARVCLRLKRPGQEDKRYEDALQKKMVELRAAFEQEENMFKVFRLMEECFGDCCFELKDLIEDERRKVFECLLAAAAADLDAHAWRMFARVTPLVESMLSLGMTPPQRFAAIADEHIHSLLLEEFMRRPLRPDNVRSLLQTAKLRNINWRQNALEPEIRTIIESLARKARQSPTDTTARHDLTAAVIAANTLPFAVDYYETQNHCYALLRDQYPEIKDAAEKGDTAAVKLGEEFQALGALLSIKMPR